MGAFDCAYIRVPNGAEPESFARKIAGLVQRPDDLVGQPWTVDYAIGYEWLHIEGIVVDDARPHPALAGVEEEIIILGTFEGVGFHGYQHYLAGECLRSIIVADGEIRQEHGSREPWEESIAADWKGECPAENWPLMFDTRHVVSALSLPSPWESGPPECWDLEVEICS